MSNHVFYRYFARNCRPSEIPPFFNADISRVVDYAKPVNSGNGKKMYGFIDFASEPNSALAKRFGLEAAPVNPITL